MKVTCPRHNDVNASCEVYEDQGWCFVCGVSVPLEELGVTGVQKKEKENIQETFKYIKSLPMCNVRALSFHTDSQGYYIVWPDSSYYKRRNYNDSPRYKAPTGCKPPLFVYPGTVDRLVLVEGEINCISLHQSYPETRATVASFGGINNIYTYYDTYLTYNVICIIIDKDIPGVVHGLEMKRQLLSKGKKVTLIALPQDFNDVLVKSGIEGIKKVCNEEGLEL